MPASDTPDPFAMSSGIPGIQGDMRPKPKLADRISKRIIWVALMFLSVILAIFMFAFGAMDTKDNKPSAKEAEAAKQKEAVVEKGTPKELKGDAQDGKPTSSSLAVTSAKEPQADATVDLKATSTGVTAGSVLPGKPAGGALGVVPPMGGLGSVHSESADSNGQPPQLTPEQVIARDTAEKRRLRTLEARAGGLSVKSFAASGEGDGPSSAAAALTNLMTAAQQSAANGGVMSVGMQQNTKGDAEQDEKLDFIKNASKEDRGYHQHVPLPPVSPNEVKFGTYLPMQIEQGMNSDLPGEVTARITEDVYDTVTGCRLLIPANSKAMGRYDSKVAVGQNRALIVWNRMYSRDGSELNLSGMQAYDTSGAAGMSADVDNHYFRLFGLAFGMSMVTAGVQLSVPSSNSTANSAPTVEQAVATALAQQYGQLGAQILGKYMAVQPTLRNHPGERFTIMVPRTMVFRKIWRNRCPA